MITPSCKWIYLLRREVPVAERGVGGKLQRMFQKRQSTPFVWKKHFVIELFFTSTNMTFGFPVVSHISNKSLTSISPFVRFLSGFEDKLYQIFWKLNYYFFCFNDVNRTENVLFFCVCSSKLNSAAGMRNVLRRRSRKEDVSAAA